MVSEQDLTQVAEQLGRTPQGDFEVVVRDQLGLPVVIRNAPLLRDGTPMPTLYWLVGRDLIKRIGHLESRGGVRLAERVVDQGELARAHDTYAAERDELFAQLMAVASLPPDAPRPSGGVGGTRQGVKCLHAHYAYWLAGREDPVGRWVEAALEDVADELPVTSGTGDL